MTISQIYKEVENSTWQPTFKYTVCQADAIDSMLLPHEDYFLQLHDCVKEILDEESNHFAVNDFYINIKYALNLQSRLFKSKKDKFSNPKYDNIILENMYIKLGIRTTKVSVGGWNPPIGIDVNELIEECFPIDIASFCNLNYVAQFIAEDLSTIGDKRKEEYLGKVCQAITLWYKIFQTIHPLNDLNGRVGGIIMNLVSYKLTGMWLVNSKYYEQV